MSFKVLNDPTHKCDLPEPGDFPLRTKIECTDDTLRDGKRVVCGIEWQRIEKGRRKEPGWKFVDYYNYY